MGAAKGMVFSKRQGFPATKAERRDEAREELRSLRRYQGEDGSTMEPAGNASWSDTGGQRGPFFRQNHHCVLV